MTKSKPKEKFRIREFYNKLSLEQSVHLRRNCKTILLCDRMTFHGDLGGKRNIPADRLFRWADALGVNPKELFAEGVLELSKNDVNKLGLKK